MSSPSKFLFVEKYRPTKVSDCILSASMKCTFESILASGKLQNMLFSGTAGTGKTTLAKALCQELGLDYIVINGSKDANMEALRGKIQQFASTVSLSGGYKVIILDEADYLSPQVQASLRGFIEEFSNNCRFILTCNFKNKIMEPLHSRCSIYEFNISGEEKNKLMAAFLKRVRSILNQENITYDDAVLAKLIKRYYPDFRRTLNELQRHGASGSIDASILVAEAANVDVIMDALKKKDFKKMRKWVVDNIDVEPASLFRLVYDNITDHAKPNSVAQTILILAEYQYKNAFVADRELNMVACLIEIMAVVEWK